MELTGRQKVRLGAFVLSALGLAVGALAFLVGPRLWQPTDRYQVRFFESVSGLERGAAVKYQGLKIGQVQELAIAADEPRAIEVALSLQRGIRLHQGTRAVLDITGLTGLKTINLTAGDPRQPAIAPGSLLPTGASLFDQISDNVGAIIADVKVVTDRISHWFTDHNRERMESLLGNLDSLIGHVDRMLVDSKVPMHELIGAVRDTTVAVGGAAEEGRHTLTRMRLAVDHLEARAGRTLGAIERPLADLGQGEVGAAVRAVRRAADGLGGRLSDPQTGQTLGSLARTVGHINQLVQDVDMVVRSGREDFTASLSYVRQAAEDLREFSRILAQNPAALVRGRGDQD